MPLCSAPEFSVSSATFFLFNLLHSFLPFSFFGCQLCFFWVEFLCFVHFNQNCRRKVLWTTSSASSQVTLLLFLFAPSSKV